ncbi:hypothetical protein ACLAJG_17685 [Klebsiella pneumoniae]|uniref:hypothetical protein n=1 Tax=Klebsiella pneumoniae TaxID=573 RepID=UPI001C3ECFCF|nr:hypothetical protein [Klebsiella pneumoniae]HEP0957598.1 hypothetical protein [Klebsiella pneumoniae subsp. ozaenae]MBV5394363.1 hypothetical protein [Klebsiella pneumoniae]MDG0612892.1 hypothetical protein [Klebsiella pneumoniae]MDH8236421.1 hypothetical protein [Klebsiella pneumoniae]MDH8492878.1 hypothetical protein [Klebsiella pneumoniae]
MLDFIRDLYASFKQTALERVKNPVLGAFVFSWIGFNWEILAILFFSKEPIETRLIYICQNYDIIFNLMGAISITTLICFFLPRVNKFFTKVQDEPNSDAVLVRLNAKIKVAQKLQDIAELEARKKLAEKKEDKFIDNDIYQIKDENSKLNKEIESMNEQISSLNTSLIQSDVSAKHFKERADKAESLAKELNEKISEYILSEKKLKDELSQERQNAENSFNASYKRDEQMIEFSNEIQNRKDEISNLKLTINKQEEKYKLFAKTYPLYFSITNIDNISSLDITQNLIEDYNARNKNSSI